MREAGFEPRSSPRRASDRAASCSSGARRGAPISRRARRWSSASRAGRRREPSPTWSASHTARRSRPSRRPGSTRRSPRFRGQAGRDRRRAGSGVRRQPRRARRSSCRPRRAASRWWSRTSSARPRRRRLRRCARRGRGESRRGPVRRPAGTVVAQNPRPGATAEQGSSVRLNVAKRSARQRPAEDDRADDRRPSPAPAPGHRAGRGREGARRGARAFGDEGLKVDVSYVPSQEPQGRIVAQARPAGTEVQSGRHGPGERLERADPPAATAEPDGVGETTAARARARGRRLRGARDRGQDSGSEEGPCSRKRRAAAQACREGRS